MTQIRLILIAFLLLATLTSCGTLSQFTIPITPTRTKDVQPIATITVTSSPSSNAEQCIYVKKIAAPPVLPDGILALYEFGKDNIPPQTRLMDLATGEFLPVIIPADWGAPSPNYEWLMFGGYSDTKPLLFGKNGELIESHYWQDNWDVVNWINDENLLVAQFYKNDDGRTIFDNTLFRLNPFTGEWEKLLTDFPNIYTGVPLAGLDTWVSYDPTFTLATYLKQDGYIELINIKEKRIIWSGGALPYLGRWSPDGNQLAMPVWDNHVSELFLVQRNGVSSQLTNLSSIYDATPWMNGNWSPSGSYLLFTFFGWDDKVGIVNVHTKDMKFFCIPESISTLIYYWAPNEKQIVFSNKDETGWHVAILDIADGTMFYVADGAQAAGWIPTGP